ncbi:MAG TPA: hypothetical protein VHL57_12370, partial [Flavobacteriales bacterium]|nr:hypothetical protein [Flavobacteriales bacterium]
MLRTLYSLAAASTALLVNAQLAPGTQAPLQQHMTEVNAEWRVMDPATADGAHAVHFANDAERIATHLHRVHDFLSTHVPEGLSASAMGHRTFLLGKLEAYADRGVFPINTVLPYRNPVFIDPVGTACAVGQLMIESGRSDLAQDIHDAMNLAYVHDMHRSDVDTWAVEHGFTEDELAWIQPGYAPSIPWASLGGGTNNTVTAMLRLTGGDLLVAGSFTQAGGSVPCNGVVRWNGSSYTAMGTIPDGSISCAIEFNGSIYVGGSFSAGTADLLKWNNGSWVPSAAFASKYAIVYDLYVLNGTLYAAGSHSGFAGVSDGVVKLVGNTWQPVGQALSAPIQRLASINGTLVCGGQFTGNDPVSSNDIMHVAYLNGNNTWVQLGDGLNGNVFALLEHDGQLYAGGDCVGEITTYFGLARVANTTQNWEMLMPNIGNYMFSPLDGVVSILDMVAQDNTIYLGGDFYCSEIMVNGAGVAVFNGTADDVHPF